MFRNISLALVGLLMMSGAARADVQGTGSTVAERNDLQVSHDIDKAITLYTRFTIFDDVYGAVSNGVVTLNGQVTTKDKVGDIEKRVAKVDGVHEVHNNITVLPASGWDDQLRAQVARAIYNNPNFHYYGLGVNPSIHIIVENGRVTLKGVVNSSGDRTLAGIAASRFPAMSVKNELRTTQEVRDAGETD